MADIFTMKSPLAIRLSSGQKRVMAEYFHHPKGLLYFDLFWHLGNPVDTVHVVEGPVRGEGPWKVGDAVITVLGCHGTDPELASAFNDWQHYLEENSGNYPSRQQIQAFARRFGVEADYSSY